MIGLGVLGLIKGEFTPYMEWGAERYASPRGTGLSLRLHIPGIWHSPTLAAHRRFAARVLLAYLVVWLLLFRASHIFFASTATDTWWACGESAVMVAAAWVLYTWFASDWDRDHLGFATGDNGLRIARVFYGLGLIPFRPSPLLPISKRPLRWCPAGCHGTWPGPISPAVPSSRRA